VEIPLFPLRTVLFPGMSLPLRIFEERYLRMFRELAENPGPFGVVLVREGEETGGGPVVTHPVGTTARIEEVREGQGGTLLVSAKGVRRFRIIRTLAPRPYPRGEVELIDDHDWVPSVTLTRGLESVRATFPVYFRLALAMTDQWARSMPLPREPHALVDSVAQWLKVDEEAKQRLLEIDEASDRVGHLAEMLDDLVTRTREEVIEYHRRKFLSLGPTN
jgi:Lon protease-like protein